MARHENDLARVVTERLAALKAREGLTAADVGARCVPPLPRDYIAKIAVADIHRPPPERLAALDVGLGLPAAELRAALGRPPREGGVPLLPRMEEAKNHLSAGGVVTPEDVRDVDADFAATLYRIEQEARRRRARK